MGVGELGIQFAWKEVLIHSTNIKVKKQNYEKNDLVIHGFHDCFERMRTGKAGKST
jgi:hypothetical protein